MDVTQRLLHVTLKELDSTLKESTIKTLNGTLDVLGVTPWFYT